MRGDLENVHSTHYHTMLGACEDAVIVIQQLSAACIHHGTCVMKDLNGRALPESADTGKGGRVCVSISACLETSNSRASACNSFISTMTQPATLQPAARRHIVSLDLGTHSRGFAYAFASGSGPRGLCEVWPDQPTASTKTRTELRYRSRHVSSWGWTARSQASAAGSPAAGDAKHESIASS